MIIVTDDRRRLLNIPLDSLKTIFVEKTDDKYQVVVINDNEGYTEKSIIGVYKSLDKAESIIYCIGQKLLQEEYVIIL